MRSPRARWYLEGPVFAAALLLAAALCCGAPKGVVASIGSEKISREQWEAFLRSRPALAGGDTAAAAKALVRREAEWIGAGKAGLLQGVDWKAREARARRDALGSAYLAAQERPRTAPSDLEVRKLFDEQNEQRHVFHVLCAEKNKAGEVVARLAAGMGFAAVADGFSKDPSVRQNHGDLGWIRRGQTVKPFEDEIFRAEAGRPFGPFQTEFGWHVALVTEVKVPTDAEYAAGKHAILGQLEAAENAKAREAALVRLRADYPLTVDDSILQLDRTTEVAEGDEGRVVARVGPASISLQELKVYLEDSQGVRSLEHTTGPATKRKTLEEMADGIRLELAAEGAGLDKSAETLAAIWNAQRDAAASLYEEWFRVNAPIPDAQLEAFYREKPERFVGPGALRLYVLVAEDAAKATSAVVEARGGAAWQDVVGRYANEESTGNWDLGWVEVAKLSAVLGPDTVRTLELAEPGTVVGPFEGPEGPEVFKVLERKPGTTIPFAECKPQVREAYLKANGPQALREYLDGPGMEGLSVRWYLDNPPR